MKEANQKNQASPLNELILAEVLNGVLYLRLNRPEKYNAFNREMALTLQELLQSAIQQETVRCVVLTGNGKAFCSGQDLSEVVDPNGPGMEVILREHYNPIIRMIRSMPKPVLAVVNGVAAGAGANIAMACDIVLAAQSASFLQAFSKIGLIPDSGGTWLLPRIVGWHRALALAITGDKLTAAEAKELGIVYQMHADEDLLSQATIFAEKLAQMPTRAIGLIKQAFEESMQNDLFNQLQVEDDLQQEAAATADFREGLQSFLEKRTPKFTGK